MDAFYEMIDEDVHDRAGFLRGRAQVKGILDEIRTAFPDSQYKVLQVIVDGDWLTVRLEFTGTQEAPLFGWPASHRRATWNEIRVCRIQNDKTVEHYAVIDNFGMLEQLGHVKSPDRSTW